MREEYFSRDYVTIFFDREQNLGGAVWLGFMSSDEFREAISACMDVIRDCAPKLWLADNRGLKAIRQADQKWMHDEIVPELARSTIIKMASLVPSDFFGQLAVKNMASQGKEMLQFENTYFKYEVDALRWLLSDVTYSDLIHSTFVDLHSTGVNP